jgi:uncharacterized membrane protein HdeD (DUF308 family)
MAQPAMSYNEEPSGSERKFPLSDYLTRVAHQTRGSLIIRGILAIAIGVFIMARPLASVAAFALAIAIWALVDGVILLTYAFKLKGIAGHWWVLLIAGLVGVAFGGFALYYYPALSLAFAVTWTTIWLLTIGFGGIYVAMRERSLGMRSGWTLAFGILALVAGIFAAAYPGATLAALLGTISAYAVIAGVVMLVGAGKLRSLEHRAKEALPGAGPQSMK